MHVFALPTVYLPEIEKLIPAAHKRAVVGDVTLLVFLPGAERIMIKDLLEAILEQSFSHNYVYFNSKSLKPDSGYTIRYDAQGNLAQDHRFMYADPDLQELLIKLLSEVYLGKEVSQLAYCYAMNASWEDHVKNGKMNQMLKLIGAV